MKVDELSEQIKKKIIELKTMGYSNQAIADQINLEEKTDLTHDDIYRYFEKRTDQAIKVLKEDKHLQQKLADQYFDTIEKLNTIHSEMWKLFYEVKSNPELVEKLVECPHCQKKFPLKIKSYATLLKTAEMILNQIKHVDSVLGKLSKKQLNITYNVVDLSKKLSMVMPQLFNKAERQGFIKVKKKRLLKEMI